ncbi:MAG: Phenylalanine--tRNA ligase alpha subunit [Chlamydiales bacterium]|nr:Phenylalanine--tRNA ligase alpha subunit [Chlamydiales bacterium]
MDIEHTLREMLALLEQDLLSHRDRNEIEQLKINYLGKKGRVQALMHLLKDCSSQERPRMGKLINDLKQSIAEQIDSRLEKIEDEELKQRLESEKIDVTLPGKRRFMGKKHVILNMLHEAIDLLVGMGFSVQYGPDIESDYYNFEALNFSKDHPARDMHDTFYISPDVLLRTHTSNTQVRVMEKSTPPIRIIAPGKCYRNEDISARSHVLFHQIEGLYIDEDVTFADLLATLEEFFSKLLNHDQIKMRYRPSYFPFVEPGMEVDINCIVCNGTGCSVCKHTGWLEVAGAGLVHPEVLKSGGIDPEVYTGYAWGFGIERLTMLRYGIKDIRLFMEDNLKFLQQF